MGAKRTVTHLHWQHREGGASSSLMGLGGLVLPQQQEEEEGTGSTQFPCFQADAHDAPPPGSLTPQQPHAHSCTWGW